MNLNSTRQEQSSGFAVVETVLVLVIIAAIAGIGYYVVNQNKLANKTVSSASNGSASTSQAAPGTTASIDQLTATNAKTETSADNSADGQIQSNLTSANDTSSSVGGAYNENNL